MIVTTAMEAKTAVKSGHKKKPSKKVDVGRKRTKKRTKKGGVIPPQTTP